MFSMMIVTLHYSVLAMEPLWPYIDPSLQCRTSWWQNLLFINSILPNRCMPWMWYIGTDFIYYVLSPIFLILLDRSTLIGSVVSISVIVLSVAIRAVLMIAHSYPPTQMIWFQDTTKYTADIIDFHTNFYVKPYTRTHDSSNRHTQGFLVSIQL
jgi:peptidoglycan/LPS O-acetylase OafA/YrhL